MRPSVRCNEQRRRGFDVDSLSALCPCFASNRRLLKRCTRLRREEEPASFSRVEHMHTNVDVVPPDSSSSGFIGGADGLGEFPDLYRSLRILYIENPFAKESELAPLHDVHQVPSFPFLYFSLPCPNLVAGLLPRFYYRYCLLQPVAACRSSQSFAPLFFCQPTFIKPI